MDVKEHAPLRQKTTMRIGGTARYFTELRTKDDVTQASAFAAEKGVPLFILGGGSNTIFTDGEVEALVAQMKNDSVSFGQSTVTVGAGKLLPVLINECAAKGLDLSPLTGILGTVGGAIFGNAGQGPQGVWIDTYVTSVTVFVDSEWKTFSKEECQFAYRESAFKHMKSTPLIWEITLAIPSAEPAAITAEIERLLQRRIETQPHLKTAGSCFKAVGGTPAWQLIDAVQLRGAQVGGVQIAEKHANFLLNTGEATYDDACQIVEKVKSAIPEHLEVEMRFVEKDGSLRF